MPGHVSAGTRQVLGALATSVIACVGWPVSVWVMRSADQVQGFGSMAVTRPASVAPRSPSRDRAGNLLPKTLRRCWRSLSMGGWPGLCRDAGMASSPTHFSQIRCARMPLPPKENLALRYPNRPRKSGEQTTNQGARCDIDQPTVSPTRSARQPLDSDPGTGAGPARRLGPGSFSNRLSR